MPFHARALPSRIRPSLALGALLALALPVAASSATFVMADYNPLVPGFAWGYTGTGGPFTDTVLSVMDTVNGEPVFVIETSGGEDTGAREFLTNDASGLRAHGFFTPAAGVDPAVRITFDPPLLEAPAIAEDGTSFPLSGSATAIVETFGTFALGYTGSTTIVGVDPVTVPFGTFDDALRIDTQITVTGTLLGQPFEIVSSGSDWFAPGIGLVRAAGMANGESGEQNLVSFVPEPGTALLLGAGLAALGRRRATR